MNTALLSAEALLPDKLAIIEQQIHACTSFVEQVEIRDRVRAYKAAAAIYQRKDLEIKFSVLFAKCERQIAKMKSADTERRK